MSDTVMTSAAAKKWLRGASVNEFPLVPRADEAVESIINRMLSVVDRSPTDPSLFRPSPSTRDLW